MQTLQTPLYALTVGAENALLTYRTASFSRTLEGPVFEVDGETLTPHFSSVTLSSIRALNNSVKEYRFDAVYSAKPALTLQIFLRSTDASPIVRFKYTLSGNGDSRLTKTAGEKLDYCKFSAASDRSLTEVRFSEFNSLLHTFCMNEVAVKDSGFAHGLDMMGPLLCGTSGETSWLLAYEHGSQYPDAFLHFRLAPDRSVTLSAKKGNYLNNTRLTAFETVWFDFGAVTGDTDALAAAFRDFQLHFATENAESRKPYIFYNSWNYQERNRWWNGRYYLSEMNEERMLKEIDAAHEMGIDVFVIDTGWYEKTGDWSTDPTRFPNGLKPLKERLDAYGMKLGIWIAPTLAAVTSKAYTDLPECCVEWNGQTGDPAPIWETEESHTMCLVSPYWERLADTLIDIAKKDGVTYFKWDAVWQHGCNCAGHFHGDSSNTPDERADSYAFQVGIYMEKIVNKICAECPDVIVDFDITEGQRSVGLGFLSVGKYFLINNGPYYESYNIPCDLSAVWNNIFVHPGAPRTWICRSPLTFDKWIPSVLFLTHYLPDDPISSQDINLASLILGQNGIWGDLPAISEAGKARFSEVLSRYKAVREDITAEAAIKSGMTGSGFECYEKISSQTHRGVVCVFATVSDTFRYVTEKATDASVWCSVPAKVTPLENGTSLIEITFREPGAAMIFFGA